MLVSEKTDSPVQTWNPEGYVRHGGFVADLGGAVFDLLAAQKGEHILDLGCGDGRLSLRIAEAGAEVLGADFSVELLEAAKARGIEVLRADAHDLPFAERFDAVFSNAALHWMTRPDDVIAGVRRALKPGGRFVAEMGGHGNVAAICTALLAVLGRRNIDGLARWPWYYPTIEEYTARLEQGGFRVREMALIPRPTPLPTGIEGWLDTFAGPFFSGMDQNDRSGVISEMVELLAPSLRDQKGRWTADYVRLRFAADRI